MIEKYTEKNQLVKCVYLISLRIQPSLLASHAARDVLRKRRCPSPKTSLPAREGCIRIFPVILIQSWVTLEVFLHFAKVKTVWCLFSLQQLAIKISRLDRKSSSFLHYLQQSCPSDYIRHIHHAFIIIFETIHTGCCYGHTPRLARSPLHGTSFGWFVFLSSHPFPAHSFSGLYPSSGRGRQISPSLSIVASLPRRRF